jgi:hypothetical protein
MNGVAKAQDARIARANLNPLRGALWLGWDRASAAGSGREVSGVIGITRRYYRDFWGKVTSRMGERGYG